MSFPSEASLRAALSKVLDPELRRPITELGMLESATINDRGVVTATILLTIAACPLRDTLVQQATNELLQLNGVVEVQVHLKVMTPEQRQTLKIQLRGGATARGIPFSRPDSLTKIFAVTSGKGGVGKSSVTVNLACALAKRGLRVGIVDADIYGFSIPGLMGVRQAPTRVDDLILPPVAYDVKIISIGMFIQGNSPVVWRGPMLHRALEQFLSEVHFGDLDVLFLDMPPGTGDVAISVAQLLPSAQILLVTTPQPAAADIAERAGSIAAKTGQTVAGVVENMAYLDIADGERLEIFGRGGGADLSARLTGTLGYPVPLLGQVPFECSLREGGDEGVPLVLAHPPTAAANVLDSIAEDLLAKPRGLAGKSLGISLRSAGS